ncbi:hypothetical protein BH09GEM1_BH09GEM1_31790 [soil metagenome]
MRHANASIRVHGGAVDTSLLTHAAAARGKQNLISETIMASPTRSIVAGLLVLLPFVAKAQAKTLPMPRGNKVCSMMASVISVKVLDARGRIVPDVTVRMTRLRDGKSLGKAPEMGGGTAEFEIVESTALSWIAPGGDRIRLVARAGSKRATAVVRVGRDPSGCRLAKLAGPDTLTLK